ncbi:MAG: efflux RND transporter periplasmic adaptor subunit [Gemmataceae bacterium]
MSLALGGAIGTGGGYYFLRHSEKAAAANEEKKPQDDPNIVSFSKEKQENTGVETKPLTAAPFAMTVWRTGRIALNDDRNAHISAPTEGIIVSSPVRLGQTVAAGDVLAVIESRELGQTKLEAFKTRVALNAERELTNRTRLTMGYADELIALLAKDRPLAEIKTLMNDKPIGDWRQQLLSAYARHNQLRLQLASQKASAGAVAEASVRKTEAEAEAAAATFTSLVEEMRFQVKNQVRQAEIKLKEAETAHEIANAKLLLFGLTPEAIKAVDPIAEGAKASQLVVRAPFAGTVVEKHAVVSERINPQVHLFTVADLSHVWVKADVFEADLPLVRHMKDREILFRSPVAGIPERRAKVVYAGDLIDHASRSQTLIAEADNADKLLNPGLYVEIGFELSDRTPVLQIPLAGLFRHENKPFVFVKESEDSFKRVDITVGRTSADSVEVTGGLKPGDHVVVKGGFVLKSELLKELMAGE